MVLQTLASIQDQVLGGPSTVLDFHNQKKSWSLYVPNVVVYFTQDLSNMSTVKVFAPGGESAKKLRNIKSLENISVDYTEF